MTGERWIASGCVVVFLAYAALRLAAFHLSAEIGESSDTQVYLAPRFDSLRG